MGHKRDRNRAIGEALELAYKNMENEGDDWDKVLRTLGPFHRICVVYTGRDTVTPMGGRKRKCVTCGSRVWALYFVEGGYCCESCLGPGDLSYFHTDRS